MSDRPRVALLIPHYNDAAGLYRSLDSVRPDEPCDVLVVDDGSTREPIDEEQARTHCTTAGQLRVLRLVPNQGIEAALNAGLISIRQQGYEFVARLDCGDRNHPGRIARQLAFLDAHPDVVLVGTQASYVDLAGQEQFVLPLPADHDEILAYLRNNSAFMHPSVMFRTAVLEHTGLYPTDVPRAEDYALFWEMAKVGAGGQHPRTVDRLRTGPEQPVVERPAAAVEIAPGHSAAQQ